MASEATLTFLFTDIEEGSLPRFGAEGDSGGVTRLWEAHPEAMREALARHDALLYQAIEAHGGTVFKTMGDQFCAVFAAAPDALTAALAAQRVLAIRGSAALGRHVEEEGRRLSAALPFEPEPLRVRMAVHTGTAEEREGDYFGPPLNRIARLLDTGHGGQILLSLASAELIRDQLPEGADLRDLGERRLPDLTRPERIHPRFARVPGSSSPTCPPTFPHCAPWRPSLTICPCSSPASSAGSRRSLACARCWGRRISPPASLEAQRTQRHAEKKPLRLSAPRAKRAVNLPIPHRQPGS